MWNSKSSEGRTVFSRRRPNPTDGRHYYETNTYDEASTLETPQPKIQRSIHTVRNREDPSADDRKREIGGKNRGVARRGFLFHEDVIWKIGAIFEIRFFFACRARGKNHCYPKG
eukprot:TRINITY_DN734_c0_g1_i9.p1 TRINITY_DN734_c0_g1~~TRINITY_DN734_c0_g1_i9.p1  ORF type:complete len:114 (+),score=18.54 TRINITY_DN734_c0_g1_i9:36-377(+)